MKKSDQLKRLILEQLCKTPIIEAACQKAGVSRMTLYRWKAEDLEFAKQAEEAIHDGRFLVNDLAESQLISAVKDRNLPAITYWLRHHHPSYATSIEITHKIQDEHLTPEQEALVRQALELASTHQAIETLSLNPNDNEQQEPDSIGTGGGDDQGQESQDSHN